MKIRTDFVTNSSSSSFCVSIRVESMGGRSEELILNDPDGVGKPDLNCSAESILHAESVEALAELLRSSVTDTANANNRQYKSQMTRFVNSLKKTMPTMDRIKTIRLERTWNAWGEMASCLVWNDEELQSLAEDAVHSSGEEKEAALKALEQHIKETPVSAENDVDRWPTGFLGGPWSGDFVWDGTVEELAECLCKKAIVGDDDATETTVIDMQKKTVAQAAKYPLKASWKFREKQSKKREKAAREAQKAAATQNAKNSDFEIENGCLIKYKGSGGDVIIPDGVTSIGKTAFFGCKSLTSVVIPEGVTSIEGGFGGGAFAFCDSLTSVTIPESVTSIGDEAFFGCKSLKSVTIPGILKKLGKEAFPNNVQVTMNGAQGEEETPFLTNQNGVLTKCTGPGGDVTLPTEVELIGPKAFADCPGLKSVTIPEGVFRINNKAFSSCSELRKVKMPKSMKIVDADAFADCHDLLIEIAEGAKPISWDNSYGDHVFTNSKNVRVHLPHSIMRSATTIPTELIDLLAEADAGDVAAILLYQKSKAWQAWAQHYEKADPSDVVKELVSLLKSLKKSVAKPATAKQVTDYLRLHLNNLRKEDVDWLLRYFSACLTEADMAVFQTETGEKATEASTARCAGLTFVITGNVYRFKNRDAFTRYVTSQGGKVSGTVSAKTSYLVNNDVSSSSTKNRTAKSLGVPIISEEEFIQKFGIGE